MTHSFNYSFKVKTNEKGFHLTFDDFPTYTYAAKTHDDAIIHAQDFLEEVLYELLKKKKKIPLPSKKVNKSHTLSPSDALVTALDFYIQS